MNKIRTVLMIDDDVDDKILFQEALYELDSTIGYRNAGNGEEALNLLRTSDMPLLDLIFLDLNMPRMNGKVFLRKIKQIEHLRGIPVLVYTTSQHPDDVAEMQQLGAAQFITKPDSYEEIQRVIAEVLAAEGVPHRG